MADLSEKCAVFWIYAKNCAVAQITHAGLWSLQHRGQEGTWIAVSDGMNISVKKNVGLVSQVYSEQDIQSLKGHIAIGHNRYATNGGSTPEHVQPVFRHNKQIALAHNGNLPDTAKLEKFLHSVGIATAQSNDSEMITDAISYYVVKGLQVADAIKKVYPLLVGAFSITVLTADSLVAFRDRHGIRPLVMGTVAGGYIFSSESCVFPILSARFVREILPGEMVVVDKKGMRSEQLAVGKSKLDIFEGSFLE